MNASRIAEKQQTFPPLDPRSAVAREAHTDGFHAKYAQAQAVTGNCIRLVRLPRFIARIGR